MQIADFLNPNGYLYNVLMFFLVVFFAYFYASIVFNAKDISENLKRQGGFIPGIRPGEGTANFLLGSPESGWNFGVSETDRRESCLPLCAGIFAPSIFSVCYPPPPSGMP